MTSNLVYLLYQSDYLGLQKPNSEHLAIIRKSALNNARLGLTGFLHFEQLKIFQYLEGPSSALEAVFEKIKDDKRHSNTTVLAKGSVAARRFPDWDMGMSEATDLSMESELTLNSQSPSAEAVIDFLARAADIQRQKDGPL